MSLMYILAETVQQAGTVVQHVVPVGQSTNGFEQITLGNIAGSVSVLFGGWMLWLNMDKRRRETAKEASDGTDRIMTQMSKVSTAFDTRVDRLEQKTNGFMPRAEIVAAIEHEKNNRIQAMLSLQRIGETNTAAINSAAVQMGKIEQKHDGLENDVSEIKSDLKEIRGEIKSGFKDVNDSLHTIAKSMS